MASKSLERKTRFFALKQKRNKSFPAVVVGAEKSRSKNVDKSGLLNSSEMVKKLKMRLKSIGDLYTKVNGNSIGCCAEVNAANRLLMKKPYIDLNEIVFSTPIRPRTMQKVKMCQNCKNTFK